MLDKGDVAPRNTNPLLGGLGGPLPWLEPEVELLKLLRWSGTEAFRTKRRGWEAGEEKRVKSDTPTPDINATFMNAILLHIHVYICQRDPGVGLHCFELSCVTRSSLVLAR